MNLGGKKAKIPKSETVFTMTEIATSDLELLAEYRTQINQLHLKVIDHVVQIGQLLTDAKHVLRGNGDLFHRWIVANLYFSPQTARNYMRVATEDGQRIIEQLGVERFSLNGLYAISALEGETQQRVIDAAEQYPQTPLNRGFVRIAAIAPSHIVEAVAENRISLMQAEQIASAIAQSPKLLEFVDRHRVVDPDLILESVKHLNTQTFADMHETGQLTLTNGDAVPVLMAKSADLVRALGDAQKQHLIDAYLDQYEVIELLAEVGCTDDGEIIVKPRQAGLGPLVGQTVKIRVEVKRDTHD